MEDIRRIMELIPHRYPFLLVDRVIEVGEDAIKGIKNVSMNEGFFQGHFPAYPIMPGVLIVEGMAQCAGCLMARKLDDLEDKLIFFARIDKVRFRKPVLPGDQLRYEIDILRWRRGLCEFEGKTYVGDVLVCEAVMMASLIDSKSL